MRLIFQPVFGYVAVCFLFVAPELYAQTLEFELSYERREQKKEQVDPQITDSRADQLTNVQGTNRVVLWPTGFSVEGVSGNRIYDFASNRRIHLYPDQEIYFSVSLYAWPVFREQEKRNRVYLAEDARAKGFENYPLSRFELDTIFNVSADGNIIKEIEFSEQDGVRQFSHHGNGRMAYTVSDQPIPAALMEVYRRYLVHEHEIHPVVIEMLMNEGRLFQTLESQFRVETPNLTDVSFQLGAVVVGDHAPVLVPEGFTHRLAPDDRLDAVIEQSRSTSQKTRQWYQANMQTYLDAGDFLQAYVVMLEFNNQYGTVKSTALEPLFRRLFDDAPRGGDQMTVERLGQAIRAEPVSADVIRDAIATIEEAQTLVAYGSHVLDVFAANFQAMLTDPKDYQAEHRKAVSLLLGALEENPHMTGAFQDLGAKYYNMFRMQDAWSAWDEMRRINPDHRLAQNVDEFERKVRKAHPSAFLDLPPQN